MSPFVTMRYKVLSKGLEFKNIFLEIVTDTIEIDVDILFYWYFFLLPVVHQSQINRIPEIKQIFKIFYSSPFSLQSLKLIKMNGFQFKIFVVFVFVIVFTKKGIEILDLGIDISLCITFFFPKQARISMRLLVPKINCLYPKVVLSLEDQHYLKRPKYVSP